MKFSLKNYLNESLQSLTVINKLLNDPGGFCKFYKSYYYDIYSLSNNDNHLWDQAYILNNKLSSIFDKLYNKNYSWRTDDNTYTRKSSTIINHTSNYIDLTDDLCKKAHAVYMNTYNKFMRVCKLLFTKPSTEVLTCILYPYTFKYNTISPTKEYAEKLLLSNVTDDMFTVYTYSDIKKDSNLYADLLTTNNKRTIFYMLSDNTLEAVEQYGQILLISPYTFLQTNGSHRSLSGNEYEELMKGNTDIYIKNEFTDTLSDGTELKWPILKGGYSTLISKILEQLCLLYFDREHADLPFNTGKFLHKSSALLKRTRWGKSVNDYVIVFSPHRSFSDDDGLYNNKLILGKAKMAHKADVKQYVTPKFKWIYDIFGNVYPYGGTKSEKSEKLYKFMDKTTNLYMKSNAYDLDEFCVKMLEANNTRYNSLKAVMSSYKKIDKDLQLKYNDLLNILLTYINFGNSMIPNIKTHNKLNLNLLELTLLFSAYQFALNDMMAACNKIKLNLDNIIRVRNNIINDIKNSTVNNNLNSASGQLNDISNLIDNTILLINTQYIPALEATKLKYDELTNNKQ